MGDVSLNQALINEGSLPLPGTADKQGDQVQGLLSAGWTNERHSSYISSMEASFVAQLYGHEDCDYDANRNNLHSGFKVIQEGVSKNIRFQRNDARSHDIAINYLPQSTLVRRLRSRGVSVTRSGNGMERMIDGYGSGTDMREKVWIHAREVKTSVEENVIDKSKEVTDQNFPDEGIESSDEPCKKQKPISGTASDDQGGCSKRRIRAEN